MCRFAMTNKTPLLVCLLAFLRFYPAKCQRDSPCPNVFTYGEKDLQNDQRWYGTVKYKSPEELNGIWMNIILDFPSDSLGNWFGEATTKNNKDYFIKKMDFVLAPNKTLEVRFYVKVDISKPRIPSLDSIVLNGRRICKSEKPTSTTPKPTTTITTTKQATTTATKTTIATTKRTPMTPQEPIGPIDLGLINTPNTFSDIFPGDIRGSKVIETEETECGIISDKAVPLIVNGFNTSEGQFPWHIALYAADASKVLRYICGGSLLNKEFVVTAAHCITVPRTTKAVELQRLQVYLGTSNLVQFDEGVQFRQLQNAYIHPQFNPRNYFNDIALLKLNKPVDLTDNVRPVCMWSGDLSIDKLYNTEGLVVGWGHDGKNTLSDVLKGGYMPIVDTQTCIWSNRRFFSQVTFDKNYCAGYREGANVCNGDSGGGMIFRRNGTSIWQLRGLVSLGVALQNSGQCNPKNYAVFTDVAKHQEWMNDIIENRILKERYI